MNDLNSFAVNFCLIILVVTAISVCDQASAQQTLAEPNLLAIFPAGGKTGETVTVEIKEQNELELATGLVFSHAGITAKPVTAEPDRFYPDGRQIPNTFEVAIHSDTPPGVYEVRATSRYGTSNARRFVVGNLQELIEQEPNNKQEEASRIEVGSTMNATFGADFDYYLLSAKQGQRLVIDCQSERIDSRGDPVLALLDLNGRTLQRVQDTIGLDATIAVQVDQDRDYLIRVNDLTYTASGGNGTAPYRLTVSQGPWIDFVDPPFAVKGQNVKLTLYGRNLGGQLAGVNLNGQPLEKLEVEVTPTATPLPDGVVCEPFQSSLEFFYYQHTIDGAKSNPISIALTDKQLVAETESNDGYDQAQLVDNFDVLGRFDKPGDIDRFKFAAKKDQKFWIQVESHRLGTNSDPLLAIQAVNKKEDGTFNSRDLKAVDDESNENNTVRFRWSSNDPAVEFTAPEDGEYYVLVQDQFSSSNVFPTFYRLRIDQPSMGFSLLAAGGINVGQNGGRNQPLKPCSCVVRRGSAAEILLVAKRFGGLTGDIQVTVDGLPAGVTAATVSIGPTETLVSMVVHASADAQKWSGPIKIIGRAVQDGKEITSVSAPVEVIWNTPNNNQEQTHSRIGSQVVLSVDDETPMPGHIETAATELKMARGGKLEVPFKFVKAGEFSGGIAVFPSGLPQQISRNNINLQPDGAEAKMNLDIQQTCEPGRYSFFVRSDLDVDFKRYPEIMDAAKQDQDRIGKLFNELQQALQKATQARQQADQAFQQTTNLRNTSTSQRDQKKQVFAQMDQQLAEATKQDDAAKKNVEDASKNVAQAKATLDAAKDDAEKQAAQAVLTQREQQLQAANTAQAATAQRLQQITTTHTAAKTALEEAEKVLADAEKKLQEAEQTKKTAAEQEKTSQTDRDMAQQRKNEVDQRVQQANQTTQQRKVKAYAYSPMITIEVVPYPIALELEKPNYEIVAGDKAEIVVTSKREFEAEDEIRFQIRPPNGVGGWSLSQNPMINKSENQGKFELSLNKDAKPGEYAAELQATYRFNNRQVTELIPLQVIIKAAPSEQQ